MVRDAEGLRGHRDAWQGLVETSLEPNVFYEPGAFAAALACLPRPGTWAIALVFAPRAEGRALVGFFPFYQARGGPFGRIKYLRLFTHFHSYLSTPLVDRDSAEAVIDCLLDWVDRRPGGIGLFHFVELALDGGFAQVLCRRLALRRQPHLCYARSQRALFRPAADAETYLRSALGGKRRKELRRQLKRLGDLGKVALEPGLGSLSPAQWAERFLILEAAGWKGRTGTAIARDEAHRRYFIELLEQAHARGRLMVLGLCLDGRPIALKCNLLAGGPDGGAYAYKIAFDPALARYSPGVLLEIETIRALHAQSPRLGWMDSCALPDHPMIERLWPDRRPIARLVVGSAGPAVRGLFTLLARWKRP